MFIDTSKRPTPAPKISSDATSWGTVDTVARNGSVRHINPVDNAMTNRHPRRAARAPANGMATIEPPPRHRRSSPSSPSSILARILAYGTSGAQAAIPKPAIKNTMRVESCSCRPGVGWMVVEWMVVVVEDIRTLFLNFIQGAGRETVVSWQADECAHPCVGRPAIARLAHLPRRSEDPGHSIKRRERGRWAPVF